MSKRCVVCGKKYKRSVTAAHKKSHKISNKKYEEMEDQLTDAQWKFYWRNEKIRETFVDPIAELDEPVKGFWNYSEWVQDRHPELS